MPLTKAVSPTCALQTASHHVALFRAAATEVRRLIGAGPDGIMTSPRAWRAPGSDPRSSACGEESFRVGPQRFGQRAGGLAGCFEAFCGHGGGELRCERIVTAVMEMLERRDGQQCIELTGHREASQVVVESGDVAEHADGGATSSSREKTPTRSTIIGSVAPACGMMNSMSVGGAVGP